MKQFTLKEVEQLVKKAWIDGNYNTDINGMPNFKCYHISNESYWKDVMASLTPSEIEKPNVKDFLQTQIKNGVFSGAVSLDGVFGGKVDMNKLKEEIGKLFE